MCIYVFIYGIEKIEIYSYNKEVNTLYTVVTFAYYILTKCAKTREPNDECCVLWYTYTGNNIHDPISLDKLKNHKALLYITLQPFPLYIYIYNSQHHLSQRKGQQLVLDIIYRCLISLIKMDLQHTNQNNTSIL